MLKKSLLCAVALAMLAGLATYFSPHWTAYRMRDAIEARDQEAFSRFVDYPSLRESFKQQLARDAGGDANPFSALGEGMARAVAGPLIDLLLGPAALMEMLNAGEPALTRAVMSAAVSKVPASAQAVPEMALRYRDWNTVVYRRVEAADGGGAFIFRRQGWWRWKLSAVELG